jgi:hypothetical protein
MTTDYNRNARRLRNGDFSRGAQLQQGASTT